MPEVGRKGLIFALFSLYFLGLKLNKEYLSTFLSNKKGKWVSETQKRARERQAKSERVKQKYIAPSVTCSSCFKVTLCLLLCQRTNTHTYFISHFVFLNAYQTRPWRLQQTSVSQTAVCVWRDTHSGVFQIFSFAECAKEITAICTVYISMNMFFEERSL